MSPALSVVVPSRDRPELLRACLEALAEGTRPSDEVIVVDSASASLDTARVALGAEVRLVRCDRPGAARARNVGLAAARHPVVAFVDDDVRVAAGWAEAMTTTLVMHPEIAFVTGRIEVPPEQRHLPRPVAVKDDAEPAVIDRSSEGTLGHSASLAVRRDALERVGGFDEALGPGAPFRAAEDTDLFDRLLAAGCVGRYEPAARAWHDQWRTRRDLVGLEWSYGVGTGARLRKLLAMGERARARRVATETVWRNGVATIPRSLTDGYELGAALAATRAFATAVGLARAALVPVRDGRLRP